jgi:RNA polymerase sigma factor for flagellar operon FliA
LALKDSDAALWAEYLAAGDESSKEKIVRRYLPLVKYVAARMAVSPPSGLDYDDLLSFGVFGLLDAIDRFDVSKGFSFQTFAVPRIRGAILDELRKYDWISRSGREKLQKLGRAMDRVMQEKGALTDSAVMEAMGSDEKEYREALELSSRSYIVSLDEVLALEDGEVSRDGIIPDEGAGAGELLEEEDEATRVAEALKGLPEREMQVVSLYYYEGLTLKEIGKILGVTESRVSQIHGKALASLRVMLASR